MAWVAACRWGERLLRPRTQRRSRSSSGNSFSNGMRSSPGTHATGAPSQGLLGSLAESTPRQHFVQRRAAADAEPVTGKRVLGLVANPRIARRFALTSVVLTNRGTRAQGRGAVDHVRAERPRLSSLCKKARGRNGTSTHLSHLARSTRANDKRGSDPGRQKEWPSRSGMVGDRIAGCPSRNTRCPSRTRPTRATAPSIGAAPIPSERSRPSMGFARGRRQ